jgi:hypothetical protein
MSSTAFHSPETVATQPISTFEFQFGPVPRSILEFPHAHAPAKDPHNEEPNRPACVRGVRSALAIEAIMALLIYGVWQISHLLR